MQKAKAMERLTAVKNGTATDTNVSGLSGLIPSKTPMNSKWKKEGGNQVLKITFLMTQWWQLLLQPGPVYKAKVPNSDGCGTI